MTLVFLGIFITIIEVPAFIVPAIFEVLAFWFILQLFSGTISLYSQAGQADMAFSHTSVA